jgi:hypothetical protein
MAAQMESFFMRLLQEGREEENGSKGRAKSHQHFKAQDQFSWALQVPDSQNMKKFL